MASPVLPPLAGLPPGALSPQVCTAFVLPDEKAERGPETPIRLLSFILETWREMAVFCARH